MMLNKNPFFVSRVLCLAVCLLLASECGSKKSQAEEKTENKDLDAVAIRNEVLNSLRASNITAQLNGAGALFQANMLNKVDRAHDYLKENNKGVAAANLGVYMSDLGYLMAFNQQEEGKRYFEACFLLAQYAGIEKQFSKVVSLRFNEIISGDEAIEKSLDHLFRNARDTSTGEDFKKMHAAALAGYFIEELYHLEYIAQSNEHLDSERRPELQLMALRTVINQKKELNNLIGYFDHIQLKSEGIAVYQNFLKMQAKYLALDDVRLLKETDPILVLKDENLQVILDFIGTIRNGITDF